MQIDFWYRDSLGQTAHSLLEPEFRNNLIKRENTA